MTTPATPRKAGPFNGNGAQTSFPFTFKVFARGDVKVVRADEEGLLTDLVLDTDYSVTLNANQDTSPGGTVTYPISGTALPLGCALVVLGDIDLDQPLDLPSGGNFAPQALENQLDRIVMQIQQVDEEVGRALRLPATIVANPDLPTPVGGNVIGWDEAGTALRNIDPATLASIVAYGAQRVLVADGGAASYTLESDPGVIANTTVVVGGVVQTPGVDYTLSGPTLTPTAAFPAGTGNVVIFYGQALPVGTVAPDMIPLDATMTYAAGSAGAHLTERVSVKDFPWLAKGDGVTDDAAAIQAAIDAVYLRGGGQVFLPLGVYVIGTTLVVPQRVVLVGESSAFANQYVDSFVAPRGSALFAKTGLNADVVQVICRLYSDSGVLKETDLGTRNSDARHFGGLRDLIVWGNRSLSASPTAVDLNSTGHGVFVKGSRYVEIERVATMFCASDGFRTSEYDYGTGTVFTNNTSVRDLTSLSNAGYGVNAREGDSRYFNVNAGYNGLGGVKSQAGNTIFNGGLAWNNRSHGVWVGFQSVASSSSFIGWLSYDNDRCGFKLDGSTGRTAALLSCIARGNGRDTGATATDRANFYVSATTRDWCILGCESNGYDQDSVQTAQYGYYIDNTTYNGSFSGSSRNAVLADYIFSDAQKMNTNTIPESSVRFGGWDTLSSITSNTIPVANKSTITLNCTGAQTVNDISYSGPGLPMVIIRNISTDTVTLVHNNSKLRLANATNVVLGQHEAVMMIQVAGAVWQQIGLAA